jgi:hypothetical protein
VVISDALITVERPLERTIASVESILRIRGPCDDAPRAAFWLRALRARRRPNIEAVAMANKNARAVLWKP